MFNSTLFTTRPPDVTHATMVKQATRMTAPAAQARALHLLLVLICAQSQPTVAQPVAHPVIGTWSWSGFAGKCVETYQYRTDGIMLSTSGEALTEWRYNITPQASETGFYKLTQTSVRKNGKKDCSGDVLDEVNEVGRAASVYLQINPAKDRHIVCKTGSLAACFGPLGKVQ